MPFFQKLSIFLGILILPYLLFMNGLVSSHSNDYLTLNGAGGSFPYPLYSKWFFEYAKIKPSIHFNYQPIGSGGGIQQLLNQTIDFAGSDSPIPDILISGKQNRIIHIPTVAGAVVIAFNLPKITTLYLDKDTIGDIFLGNISRWNDARIAALNPQSPLPNLPIVIIHRSDGSGTTYIFTEYLSKISPSWAKNTGKGTAVQWPMGIGAKGNAGVAAAIKTIQGSIGYLELAYAVQNNFPMAAIKNRCGQYVLPSIRSVVQSFPAVFDSDDLRISLTDSSQPGAYPIAGLTWILLNSHTPHRLTIDYLCQFLSWALTEGQAYALPLDYSPLPQPLRQKVLTVLESLTGKSPLSDLFWKWRVVNFHRNKKNDFCPIAY
ncbi:phosphate ABC transporter substrate-binding protein PstS [Methylacidiphilum caldifontis]|uniref:phosphate ABC transporter substrate-binding protein PstS n=1 Tax=Methylacidiphilum caldifontis TaxID=2795386 RepID=UPI001A8E59F7|nr:phosphate ABC transporter substrate-binding protein PstS [Methylacidiphilum caldifontis]QSR88314.1 phosphate ABC transporter substrate-binding protein PstS [Methylacidiphilum caldifontis]